MSASRSRRRIPLFAGDVIRWLLLQVAALIMLALRNRRTAGANGGVNRASREAPRRVENRASNLCHPPQENYDEDGPEHSQRVMRTERRLKPISFRQHLRHNSSNRRRQAVKPAHAVEPTHPTH